MRQTSTIRTFVINHNGKDDFILCYFVKYICVCMCVYGVYAHK